MDTKIIAPEILSEKQYQELKDKTSNLVFVNAFDNQLKELFFIENNQFIGQPKAEVYQTTEFAEYCEQKKQDFNYIFYPWLNTVVKTVKKDNYLKLKTNRNQDLITAEEQKILQNYKVAVLGMSVGSNIAFVITQTGISNKIIIADFDELDTTNLNRILAGLHEVGLNKTIVASHRIYEDNPYAEVTTLPDGVNNENLEELLKNGQIDCIVEEIDDVKMKIGTRKLALEYKVPVIMLTDNGDGVVLHIERYDLGYDKIFEQDLNYWETRLQGEINKQLAGDIIINDIVGGIDKVNPKMIASVERVMKKELVSWSQLGSSAILGGVVVNWTIKEIVTGKNKTLFVREYINLPKF